MRPDHTPVTPKVSHKPSASVLDSPAVIFNTPSKLERFLQAAERNGVPGVQDYRFSLEQKGYGPDILHFVSVNDLVDVSMSPGDAIRLREYASMWWAEERRRVAKRPRALDDGPPTTSTSATLPVDTTPPQKRLRFEKRFRNGGGMTVWGRAVVDMRAGADGDDDVPSDYTWWVYSNDLKMHIPLPPGKLPVLAYDSPYVDDAGNTF